MQNGIHILELTHTCNNILNDAFGLLFLHIIRLHFLRSQSIADVIRKRYSDRVLKNVRKFEKLDYQVRKRQRNIEFLITCHFKLSKIPRHKLNTERFIGLF